MEGNWYDCPTATGFSRLASTRTPPPPDASRAHQGPPAFRIPLSLVATGPLLSRKTGSTASCISLPPETRFRNPSFDHGRGARLRRSGPPSKGRLACCAPHRVDRPRGVVDGTGGPLHGVDAPIDPVSPHEPVRSALASGATTGPAPRPVVWAPAGRHGQGGWRSSRSRGIRSVAGQGPDRWRRRTQPPTRAQPPPCRRRSERCSRA